MVDEREAIIKSYCIPTVEDYILDEFKHSGLSKLQKRLKLLLSKQVKYKSDIEGLVSLFLMQRDVPSENYYIDIRRSASIVKIFIFVFNIEESVLWNLNNDLYVFDLPYDVVNDLRYEFILRSYNEGSY